MSWVLLLLVFGFGAFAAYRDIDDFFTTKNVGHLALGHWPTRGFLFFNGALSVGFLAWALFSPAESPINRALLVEDPWLKSVVVGLGVPSLLKSKLFGGESDQGAPRAVQGFGSSTTNNGRHASKGAPAVLPFGRATEIYRSAGDSIS